MTERELQQLKADAERYRHLRDGKSRQGRYRPFVMNPNESVIYAIEAYRGSALDLAVDVDIATTKLYELHETNDIVERYLLPEGMRPNFMDERYCDLLGEVAMKDLGFDEERCANVNKYWETTK